MMGRFSTKEERREARLKFFKDDVFVIAHKALQKVPCSLSVEEIFCSAERLANHLLTHEITDIDFMDYEIDDFADTCDDEDALYLILTVAFVKLCALRKVHPLAGSVAKALVHRCREFGGFTELLGELAEVEHKLRVERGRIDLYKYELKSIAKESPESAYASQAINTFVNSALDCSAHVVESVIVAFTNFNKNNHGQYTEQERVLTQGYADKLNGKEAKKIEYHIGKVEQLNGVVETGAHVVHTLKNE